MPAVRRGVRARVGSARRRSGDWGVVGSTAVMKVLVMGLSGVLGIVTSRLIIENFGVDAYAQYGLLASLPALLPFADLGIAASVINRVAGSDDPRSDEDVRRTLTSALRILVCSGLVIATVSILLGVSDAWTPLLGEGLTAGGGVVATVCLCIFGLTLPLTIGARVLVGLHRNPAQIAAQAVVAPFILVGVLVCVLANIPAGDHVALLSYLAATLSAVVCLALAARVISPQLGLAFRAIPRFRSDPGVPIMDTAWPMLIQMMALPVAMQSDRLLLSHLGGRTALAEYNLGFQLFNIVLQTISAAGVSLWPVFARARARGEIRSPAIPAAVFFSAGLVLAGAVALASDWLAGLVSGGRIELSGWLLVGFVLFVSVQSLKYPLGMYMTDKRGLRAQVIPTVLMVPISIGLGWWLIGHVGAAGPVLASAAAVAVCQVLPMAVYVAKDLRIRRS